MEVACELDEEEIEMHPMAFRVHTHVLGIDVRGWKVTDKRCRLRYDLRPSLRKRKSLSNRSDLHLSFSGVGRRKAVDGHWQGAPSEASGLSHAQGWDQ